MIWDLEIQTIFPQAGHFVDQLLDPGWPCKWLLQPLQGRVVCGFGRFGLFSSFDNLTYMLPSHLSFPVAVFGRAEVFQKLLNCFMTSSNVFG